MICEKCRAVNFFDRFVWTCPKCQCRFRDPKAEENEKKIKKIRAAEASIGAVGKVKNFNSEKKYRKTSMYDILRQRKEAAEMERRRKMMGKEEEGRNMKGITGVDDLGGQKKMGEEGEIKDGSENIKGNEEGGNVKGRWSNNNNNNNNNINNSLNVKDTKFTDSFPKLKMSCPSARTFSSSQQNSGFKQEKKEIKKEEVEAIDEYAEEFKNVDSKNNDVKKEDGKGENSDDELSDLEDKEEPKEDETNYDKLITEYESVKRIKNKWKITFKNVLYQVEGKEIVIGKMTGEFTRDW